MRHHRNWKLLSRTRNVGTWFEASCWRGQQAQWRSDEISTKEKQDKVEDHEDETEDTQNKEKEPSPDALPLKPIC